MLLTSMLSQKLLLTRAEPDEYQRGQASWIARRVELWQFDDASIAGSVVDGDRFDVQVTAASGPLVVRCTCASLRMCSHAVALVLSFLEREVEREPERPRQAPPPRPGAHLRPDLHDRQGFQTPTEVQAWAAHHEVTHLLRVQATVLAPRLPAPLRSRLHYMLNTAALHDVASWHDVRRYLTDGAQQLIDLARAVLEEEAQLVALGIAEEASRTTAVPVADPAVAELWQLLLAARRTVRSHAPPRPRSWREAQSWQFDARERTVVWKEPQRVLNLIRQPVPAHAQLAVVGGQLRLSCPCRGPEPRCVHALALLDTTLEVLEDPARRELGQVLVRELLRPSWSRALEELALQAVEVVKPKPVVEVWWRIERELGHLTLVPTVKKLTRNGTLSAGARLSVRKLIDEYRAALEPRDLAIAEALLGWEPELRHGGTYPMRAFVAAVGHPRLVSELELSAGDALEPVALERVSLGFSALPSGEQIRLEPSIEGARFEPRLLAALLASFAPGEPLFTADPAARRLLLIDVGDDARRVWAVLQKHGDAFPPEGHAQLLAQLAQLEGRLPLAIPRELKGQQLEREATTVIRLRLLPTLALELELFVRPGPGAPMYPPGVGPRDVLLAQDGERGYIRRNLGEEAARVRAALTRLPLDLEAAEEGPPGCFRVAELDAALDLVTALETPPPGIEADWISERPTIGSTLELRQLRVTVEHRRDWFGIVGDLKVETGRLELAVLLDAARRQQRWVQVGERRWAQLSDLLRARLGAIADQTFVGKQRMELSPGAVPAIRALAEAGARVETAPSWQQLTERLAASTRLRPHPPTTLQATLRDYQVEGHAWLARLAAWGAGACLADDMGLGKTVQAIALLLDRAKVGPALVLAPTSVCWNWVEELARFAPSLRPVLYAEQADRGACLAGLGKKDVLIASYGLLVRDAEALASVSFGTLIVDEAQALKNASTRRARAARGLQAGFRVALSGTPLENHLGELWSLFAIVFPGLLGSWEQFRDRFAGPIERNDNPEARAALSRVIRPFLLRRTKAEVARELPARTEIQVPVALSREEHQLYEDARLAAVAELSRQGKGVRDEQRRFQVLAALTRLRLLASHPRLYDPTSAVTSSKLRRLVELLEELRAEGHRALVFSQFTSHLALVREALDEAGIKTLYLDGATPAGQRKARVKAFQAGEGEAFLISLKAGGTGLNLTAADYVIHLDPWWNPAVEDQASDRAHRIGQTQPVTVYRLIAHGTIEEKMLSMHAAKRALVAGVLDGTDVAARLSTRDLVALLSSGPEAPVGAEDEDAGASAPAASAPPPARPPARPRLTLVP